MPTTTYDAWTVRYDSSLDPADGEPAWDVVDSDGLVMASHDTENEAAAEAAEHNRDAECEWLAAQIQERIDAVASLGGKVGLDALRAMADFVGGIR